MRTVSNSYNISMKIMIKMYISKTKTHTFRKRISNKKMNILEKEIKDRAQIIKYAL